jgi:hypothetical protein
VPGEFARIVREGFEQHVAPTQTDGPGGYLLSPERLAEADAVGPCVGRLATAEVQPPAGGLGVGRSAGTRRTAPLAEQLGSRLARAEPATRGAARAAVLRALAVGYGGMIDLEAAAIEGGRTITVRAEAPEAVWSRWVATLDGSPVLKQVHRQSIGVLHRLGQHALLEGLRAAGIAPRLRAGRLQPLAWWYVEAGLSLRALQTDLFAEEGASDAEPTIPSGNGGAWPFDSLPESLPA